MVRTPSTCRATARAPGAAGHAGDPTLRGARPPHYAEPAPRALSVFSRRPVSTVRRARPPPGYGYRSTQGERIAMTPTPTIADDVARTAIQQLMPALSTTVCRAGGEDLDAVIET